MAIKHDPSFIQTSLFSDNSYWSANATRRELTPFEYMVHQRKYHGFRDPNPVHFRAFKANFEMAVSAVEEVLKVGIFFQLVLHV
ncbi:hypothetical protein NMY22_g17632 [Coprinellus aureogranulatus]|nr:hypothetical protein NMY22_g17632 [Coprinellus aureogranulatus]